MVSLAKDMEGKPFHLLAAHCQRNDKASVVGYIRSQGLAADTPNMTVTSFGGHPGVKGNGYVPYYMVFDHRGKLRHHHMCGAYHGGDGLKMIEWVERLVAETPVIYLGEAPFEHMGDLAEQISAGKKLGQAAKMLEVNNPGAAAPAMAERERLYTALTAWRDRELAATERLMATTPSEVLGALDALAKELKGSELATVVEMQAIGLKGGDALKESIALERLLAKTQRKIDGLKVPKAAKRAGIATFDPDHPACRAEHAKTLQRSAKKLRDAIAEHADLPIAATIETYAARLGG